MPADIVWNPVEFAKLHYDPVLLHQVQHDVEPVVRGAQADAPKRTGAGAESIHSEVDLSHLEPGVAIGWERDRFYMFFHERGTRYLPARPFLVPALDRYL